MRTAMILVTLTAASLASVAAPVRAQTVEWRVEPSRTPGEVQFTLQRRSGSSIWINSDTTALTALEGLSPARLGGRTAPVRFELTRGAGRLDCNGEAGSGRGAGTCAFRADPAFAAALQRRGIGPASGDQLFRLTMTGIGTAYLDELDRQRLPRPTIGDLVSASDHGVRLDYLQAVRNAGYRPGSLAAFVRMRDHGVSPDFLRAVAAAGLTDLRPDDLVRLRDHGVSPEFVTAMRGSGYGTAAVDDLIRLRDNGVSADYVRELAKAGIKPSIDNLVRLRSSGVRPDFVVAARSAGYGRFGTEDLIRLRDNGVNEAFMRELGALGYRSFSADELVRLRSNGVTPDFIRRAGEALGTQPTAAAIVRMRTRS